MKNKCIFPLLFLFACFVNAQESSIKRFFDISDVELDVRKFGPYIGWQQGRFSSVELGVEFQHKNITLFNPTTHSFHFGFNYNFSNNLLGYDLGYWYKAGRFNLTYGANALFRTDYAENAVGIAPVIGFKFGQLHMQTGYNFLTIVSSTFPCNTFFMTIRFVLVQKRNFIWKK